MKTLNDIENITSEKLINPMIATDLKFNLSKFESISMAVFWTSLLDQFNKTSKVLHSALVNYKMLLVCTNI